jgi:hypothetical protein
MKHTAWDGERSMWLCLLALEPVGLALLLAAGCGTYMVTDSVCMCTLSRALDHQARCLFCVGISFSQVTP